MYAALGLRASKRRQNPSQVGEAKAVASEEKDKAEAEGCRELRCSRRFLKTDLLGRFGCAP